VQLNDLLLIPQQLSPIEKLDPSDWYLRISGKDLSGVGLMFGALSQAAIGGGITELIIRAAALALVLGLLHRWYVRHASSLLWTVFYIWLCTIIYYSYRATTFYWDIFILYRFIPFAVSVKLISLIAGVFLRAPRPEPALA
jgi:hypothetical protein